MSVVDVNLVLSDLALKSSDVHGKSVDCRNVVVDCDLVSSNSLLVLGIQIFDPLFPGCTFFGPAYNDESVIFNQLGDSPFVLSYLRLNSLVVLVGDLCDDHSVLLSDRDDVLSKCADGDVETFDIFIVKLDSVL